MSTIEILKDLRDTMNAKAKEYANQMNDARLQSYAWCMAATEIDKAIAQEERSQSKEQQQHGETL